MNKNLVPWKKTHTHPFIFWQRKKNDTNYKYQERNGIFLRPSDIKRLIREYYKTLCIHTFTHLDKMGSENHKLP